MALTTVTLHGQILNPDGLTPAVGTVTFNTLIELRDIVDNIIYTPASYVATLDVNGEFTIVLPATDNPDITPLNWVYQVYVSTTAWRETFYIQLPFAPGTTELADLEQLDYNPCTAQILGAPTPPDNPNLYVLKAGDTMTGNLIINANLQVSGDANVDGSLTAEYQGLNGDVMRLLSTAVSTGLTSGGQITINANPALVDISAATGWVVDYNSTGTLGPANPTITYVTYPGQTGIAPLPGQVTYWLISPAGTIINQATPPTRPQTRQNIFLGATVAFGGIVVAFRNLPMVQSQPGAQLVDLMTSLGAFNVTSTANSINPNGVNRMINTNGGDLFILSYGVNFGTYLNPHITTLAAQTPATFRYATATALIPPFVNNVDVANYDPNGLGVVTPVGGGANTTTIHRVYVAGAPAVNEQIIIQYGQFTYASISAAIDAIGRGIFTVNPLFTGALTGYIVATRTAVNLSDPAQAVFIHAGRFAAP
jgi:hypothetical protein